MVVHAFLIAVVLTAAIAPAVRWSLLRYHVVDLPNQRSSHSVPTPRGGGIAVALAAVIALIGQRDVVTLVAVAGSASLMGVVGFADDKRGLRPRTRLAVQILIPACVLPLLLKGMGLDGWWTWVFGVGVVVWCATYVNAFNFMDGINGMAVGQTLVGGVGLAIMGAQWSNTTVSVLGIAIAGAAVGFAPYNAPVAHLFLGDVGSYFIGCWLAATIVVALRAGIPPEVVIAPFLVYLLDTGFTLWRRWRRGESLMTAHREHAYQRLAQYGWSQMTVSLTAASAMALCTLIAVAVAKSPPGTRVVATAISVLVAAGFALLPSMLHVSRGGAVAWRS